MHPKTLEGLHNIRVHCQYIIEDLEGVSFEDFVADRHPRQLVLHNLLVIGHGAARVREGDLDLYDSVPELYKAVGLRNRIAHGYEHAYDNHFIWEAATESVPKLLSQVNALLDG